MLSEFLTASFLLTCLATFFVINLFNVAKTLRRRGKVTKGDAEVSRPRGFFLSLAIVGTVSFFLISVVYPFLVFTGAFKLIQHFPMQLVFQHDLLIQLIGMLVQTVGYILFLWSVLERGRDPSVLVTWGPFRYVRHPSYLGYFLMFLGLFFLLLNLAALVPLIAIPGYIHLTIYEEQMLIARFGNDYVEYQKTTGRFVPKMKP